MSQNLKRPHAATSTHSSPPSARVRVKEPEIQFTLLSDGAELADLSDSIFDGQLSDTSTLSESDTDSDELPLTESSATSEVVVDYGNKTRFL
jgi:hypothetical protein